MSLFKDSSHELDWIVGEHEIRNIHNGLNNTSVGLVGHYDIESEVLKYFCQQILTNFGVDSFASDSHSKLKRRWRVAATAVTFFRRFYVHRTMKANDPRLYMLCSMFLAGKLEEHYTRFIHMSELLAIYNGYTESDLLSAEIVLVEALRFDLSVFHPLNCINTLLAGWKLFNTWSKEVNVDLKQTLSILSDKWLKDSQMIFHHLQVTTAILSYKPLSIAVCALHLSEPVLGPSTRSFKAYILATFGNENVEALLADVFEISKFVELGKADIDMDLLAKYMRELKQVNTWSKRQKLTL